MDRLIGGPDRPPSKRMIEQQRAEEAAQRTLARQGTDTSSSSRPGPAGKSQEGYWEYMQRQIQERTENLGLAGDNMDKMEENSQGFADDVGKYVGNAKKKAVMGRKFPAHLILSRPQWSTLCTVKLADERTVIGSKLGF